MITPLYSNDLKLICNANVIGDYGYTINSLSIDSRLCQSNDHSLFVCLKGNRTDGHSFITELYKSGVRNFLVDHSFEPRHNFPSATFYSVKNTVDALKTIAIHQRSKFNNSVIGITGSNGKTIVKEWVNYLLQFSFSVCKSPKSYNSQIGVPLSILELNSNNNLAIFEAGISQPGEMSALEKQIQPTIGVLTNIGNAHQNNFESIPQKVNEKLELFKHSKSIIYCKDHKVIDKEIQSKYSEKDLITWSFSNKNASFLISVNRKESESDIMFNHSNEDFTITIPYIDESSIENAINSVIVAEQVSRGNSQYRAQTKSLPQVEMRLSYIEGINNCTILNDCYNSDLDSIKSAIHTLADLPGNKSKVVVLSDFDHPLEEKPFAHKTIATLLKQANISNLYLIGDITTDFYLGCGKTYLFQSTAELHKHLSKKHIEDAYILIKGSRKYTLETISKKLEKRTHQTVLEVNLNAISNNLNYFKSRLKPTTKVMAMVKGFSYGSGDYEIAEHLKQHKVDYLAVAFVDEGIVLRNKGIDLPIVVMNPEVENYETMLSYKLEPEIYSINSLNRLIEETRFLSQSTPIKIHVKLDTGMHRLGLAEGDIQAFLHTIKNQHNILVESVFSHLAGADSEEHDEFTREQFSSFENMCEQFEQSLSYPFLKHILNSAGSERFPEAQYDMVRLGIGLYGITSLSESKLDHISTLKTTISQIRLVPKGESIGYSRKSYAQRETKIGVIPIGYADGYDRRFSNGVGQVLVRGKKAPIIGNVCMDACMVDITDINAQEGDEVILFSEDHSISVLANQIGTIPYEILTSISKRVKRVYYKE